MNFKILQKYWKVYFCDTLIEYFAIQRKTKKSKKQIQFCSPKAKKLKSARQKQQRICKTQVCRIHFQKGHSGHYIFAALLLEGRVYVSSAKFTFFWLSFTNWLLFVFQIDLSLYFCWTWNEIKVMSVGDKAVNIFWFCYATALS